MIQYDHPGQRRLLTLSKPSSVVQMDGGLKGVLACMVGDAVAIARAQSQAAIEYVDQSRDQEGYGPASGNTWTETEVHEIVPVVCKTIVEAMERGLVKFPQAALYVRDFLAKDVGRSKADAIPFALIQGAYIGLGKRFEGLGTTSTMDVAAFESLEELKLKNGMRADE